MILMIDVTKKDKPNDIATIFIIFWELFLSQQLNFFDNSGNSKAFDTVLT